MLKKLLIACAVLITLIFAGGFWLYQQLGLSGSLQANVAVATGMSAKLACSGYHLSKIPKQGLFEDIDSYTPISSVLQLGFRDNGVTHATLLSTAIKTATYRPGLGCTLNIGDTSHLDELTMPDVTAGTEVWPIGNEVQDFDSQITELLKDIMQADNSAGLKTRALLVVQEGRIVGEQYAPGFDHKSQLLGWSMGKSITAMMLGRLYTQGQLDVTEDHLFEAWQDDERQTITIENLLQMSSGLDFDETYAPGSDATQMLFDAYSAPAVAMGSQLAHVPGSHFYYSSGTTNLLAQYMADKLGGPQALLDFLHREFYAPLNLADTTFEVDPSGILVASSYIYSSARDWAKLGLLMLNEGRHNGSQLIDSNWIEQSTSPNTSDNDPRYGYQFWLNSGADELRWSELPEDAYAMSGNRAQTVMMIPSTNTVLVRLGWSSGRYPMPKNFRRILDQLGAGE
ncbi:MAG: serine hydrolase [Pseudomonadota bacterium]